MMFILVTSCQVKVEMVDNNIGQKVLSSNNIALNPPAQKSAFIFPISFDWFHHLIESPHNNNFISEDAEREILRLLQEEEIDTLERFVNLLQEDLNELLRRPNSLSLGVKASLRAIHKEVAGYDSFQISRKRKLQDEDG